MAKYTVGVFEHAGKRQLRFMAYLRDFNPAWSGCCVHVVEADTGMMAKAKAIYAHQRECVKHDADAPARQLNAPGD